MRFAADLSIQGGNRVAWYNPENKYLYVSMDDSSPDQWVFDVDQKVVNAKVWGPFRSMSEIFEMRGVNVERGEKNVI